MITPLTVLLVAEEAAGARALQLVLDAGHRVVRVLTGSADRAPNPVLALADQAGVPTEPAALVRESRFGDVVRGLGVDLLLNVHALHVVADAVLTAPRIGSFNLHPGPLPQYAGLNGVSWAIYQGEREYGVTLHWMVGRVDAGDVAVRAVVPIMDGDTALTLGARCTRAGMGLLARLFELAAAGASIPREPQDLRRRRYYTAAEVPQAGCIDWARSAREVVRFVRACDYGPFPSPWGRPRTRLDGQEVSVLSAELTGELVSVPPGTLGVRNQRRVCVAAADEWVELRQLGVADGREVSPREALHLWATAADADAAPRLAWGRVAGTQQAGSEWVSPGTTPRLNAL